MMTSKKYYTHFQAHARMPPTTCAHRERERLNSWKFLSGDISYVILFQKSNFPSQYVHDSHLGTFSNMNQIFFFCSHKSLSKGKYISKKILKYDHLLENITQCDRHPEMPQCMAT